MTRGKELKGRGKGFEGEQKRKCEIERIKEEDEGREKRKPGRRGEFARQPRVAQA